MTMNQPPPMPARQLNLEDESHLHLLSVKMTYAANTRV
jgi:hypothetical protein